MNTAVLTRHDIDVSDIEYLRHGDKPLLARLYRPRGTGPFPIVIDLHGGAWCKKDRLADAGTCEPLAKSGVVVVALDFRMPPDAGYPASLADVNYAVRWCKTKAKEWGARADRIGIMGVSSGGHQAMLTALRPADPRYGALPAAGDATVQCAILCWPVIDPLGRYEYAQDKRKGDDAKLKKQADEWAASHDKYWPDTAAMAEGNPARALERGEKTPTPPVLYLQGTDDTAHPRPHLDRFVAAYRKAGGRVDLHFFKGVGEAFITNDPTSPQAIEAIDRIIEFVHRELR
ncbi:MAG: alpha/beta hydrolase [Burkholderiales bacterium]